MVEFLGEDSDLAKDVIACHQDNSYLADFYEKINTATDKLQGKKITLVQSKTIIRGLINKLALPAKFEQKKVRSLLSSVKNV